MGTIDSQKQDILQVISEMRKELEERYTVKRIGVFGSFARGEAGKASDSSMPSCDAFDTSAVKNLPVQCLFQDVSTQRLPTIGLEP